MKKLKIIVLSVFSLLIPLSIPAQPAIFSSPTFAQSLVLFYTSISLRKKQFINLTKFVIDFYSISPNEYCFWAWFLGLVLEWLSVRSTPFPETEFLWGDNLGVCGNFSLSCVPPTPICGVNIDVSGFYAPPVLENV